MKAPMRLLLLPLIALAGCTSRQPVTIQSEYGPDVLCTAHDFDAIPHTKVITRGMDDATITSLRSESAPDLDFMVPMAAYDPATHACYLVCWKPAHGITDENASLLASAHALRYQDLFGHRQ